MSNIQIIRLISGEEIIADVSYRSADGVYVLKEPLVLMFGQGNAPGKVGISLAPWMPYRDTQFDVEVRKEGVLMLPMKPCQDLLNSYQQIFSKLLTPTTPKLIVTG